ncbi:MAG: helix-turn-helix transcriptional regulator [Butyrivibrio sp.]|nr:helix-turn-helix transcriptional regulator [Butyrivibrio sp.]
MKAIEALVSSESEQFFHNPSSDTKEMFFYPTIIGRYTYLPGYEKNRNRFNNFLLMFIEEGSLDISVSGTTQRATIGNVVWLDCYKPHSYSSEKGARVLWMHFDGHEARRYYEYFHKKHENICLPSNPLRFHSSFDSLLSLFSKNSLPEEAILSLNIISLLQSLFAEQKNDAESTSALIRRASSYIDEHFNDNLSLEFLSDMVGLSPYYFSRAFKKETGISPHQYLIETRISSAKFYLFGSDRSISDIALSVGFKDESSFCLTFRRRVGLTPKSFREKSRK